MQEYKEEIIDNLRNLYKEKKYSEMKRTFFKNLFYISPKKRSEIWKIVNSIKQEDIQEDDNEKKNKEMIEHCVNELHWKVVNNS